LELRWFCDETRALYEPVLADGALRRAAILLSYEELIADPAGVCADRICPFLGLPANRSQPTLLPPEQRPLIERVANYSQIAALLEREIFHPAIAWNSP
jgi:hypothetical protein